MHQPIRTCVGCGTKRHKRELLRLVRSQGDKLEVDQKALKPGRGAYLCYDPACVEKAFHRKSFEKRLKTGATPELKIELLDLLSART
jgi:hypothetical protein